MLRPVNVDDPTAPTADASEPAPEKVADPLPDAITEAPPVPE